MSDPRSLREVGSDPRTTAPPIPPLRALTRATSTVDPAEAHALLAEVLRGSTRREILDAVTSRAGLVDSIERLARAMREHRFPTSGPPLLLRGLVHALDRSCRSEGLHLLHVWDFAAQRRPQEIAPVLLAGYCAEQGMPGAPERHVLSLLLDHYFLLVLSLLAVRAWDAEDPNAALDAITRLVRDLQGPQGSGHRVMDDAESLLLTAASYYHPELEGYVALLERVRTLDPEHQLRTAIPCAAIMGSHLRWGFRFMYGRDVGRMRDDNDIDYPWLQFSVLPPLRALVQRPEADWGPGQRSRTALALLGALSADPWAFTGAVPAVLVDHAAEHEEVRTLLREHHPALRDLFELVRPTATAYSPLSFGCNFLRNAVVASVVQSMGSTERRPSLSTVLLGEAGEEIAPPPGATAQVAHELMRFASVPHRLGAHGAPLIVYDPRDAPRRWDMTLRALAPRA
ncbi:MAG: hypothetical protein R3E98_19935 [Gemmatimonadota bacterium]